MILKRVQNKVELVALKDQLMPLFEEYAQRVKEPPIDPVDMFRNYFSHLIFSDCFFFTISDGDNIVGFIGGDLLRGPFYNVMYIIDTYCPSGWVNLADMFRTIQNICGANELWGEANEKVYRAYRYILKGKGVKKSQFVRVKL